MSKIAKLLFSTVEVAATQTSRAGGTMERWRTMVRTWRARHRHGAPLSAVVFTATIAVAWIVPRGNGRSSTLVHHTAAIGGVTIVAGQIAARVAARLGVIPNFVASLRWPLISGRQLTRTDQDGASNTTCKDVTSTPSRITS